jgi:hypothetical protein
MRINAADVREGDYIQGLGTVENVRRFHEERSVHGRTRSSADEDYTRMISQELDSCYSQSPGHVSVEATLGSRSYLPNDSVDVVRITGLKSKSEAA